VLIKQNGKDKRNSKKDAFYFKLKKNTKKISEAFGILFQTLTGFGKTNFPFNVKLHSGIL
jgi:hypothetical protein